MGNGTVDTALSKVDAALSRADVELDAIWQGVMNSVDEDILRPSVEALSNAIGEARVLMGTVMEQNGLGYLLENLKADYETALSEHGWWNPLDLPEDVYEPAVESRPRDVLANYLDHLRTAIHSDARDEGAVDFGRATLKYCLQQSPDVLTRAGITKTTSEKSMRDPVHEFLEMVFPHYQRTTRITVPTTFWDADAAVRDIHTLVEYKYVNSPGDWTKAIRECTEDLRGYGNSDYYRFVFFLIYMTGRFGNAERAKAALGANASKLGFDVVVVEGP